jgi:hypothetical protein
VKTKQVSSVRFRFRFTAKVLEQALLLAVLLVPFRATAAETTYEGNLLLVSREFVSIRLADGRVIDARTSKSGALGSQSIAANYKLGDHVEITAKPIDAVLDQKTDHWLAVDLKKLRFQRPPTPDEMAEVIAALYWKKGDNLLKAPAVTSVRSNPAPSGNLTGLEHVREVNLANLARMPDFIAEEHVIRSFIPAGSTKASSQDIFESDIVFQGTKAIRQNVRINEKRWNGTSAWLPGLNWGLGWGIGFGSELHAIFDKGCGTRFDFTGQEEAAGKRVLAYLFKSPLDGCFGPDQSGPAEYNAARSGRVLVDDPGGNIVRIEIRQTGVADFGQVDVKMSWSDVRIGDTSYLLPVKDEYVYRFPTAQTRGEWRVSVEFKNHRHFEASSTIQFK